MDAAQCIALLLMAAAVDTAMTMTSCQRRKYITFNAGLTPRIASYNTRRVDIPAALAATDADVLCLQEVWYENDMHAIMEATKNVYPHSFSFIHHEVDQLQRSRSWWGDITSRLGRKACTVGEGGSLSMCLVSCFGRGTGYELLACMTQECPSQLTELSQDCRTCLYVSTSGLWDALRRCSNMGKFNRFNPTGILLLSKHRLTTAVPHYFLPQETPQFLPRGFIDAQVDGVGRVMCAHLTASLTPYMELGSAPGFRYFKENDAQIWIQALEMSPKTICCFELLVLRGTTTCRDQLSGLRLPKCSARAHGRPEHGTT